MLSTNEKQRILRVRSIGPKMLGLIERSGYSGLDEFAETDPHSVRIRIMAETGVNLDGNGLTAITNLIAAAKEAR